MIQSFAVEFNKRKPLSGLGWPAVLLLVGVGLSACAGPEKKEPLPSSGPSPSASLATMEPLPRSEPSQSTAPPKKETHPFAGLPLSCLGEQVCGSPPANLPPGARESATEVLEQVYALPDDEKRYFLDKRRDAVGFAIFPNVQRQGVMVAKLYGKGILSYRENGGWSPPILLTMQGQSVGPQMSQQSSNIMFIFETVCGIRDFLAGHHHINAHMTGAVVDHVEHSVEPLDISVHVFDRGATLGQSTDTYSIHIDEDANAALYGVSLKPGCIVEGMRAGFKAPWILHYFQTLQLPPGQAHHILELE